MIEDRPYIDYFAAMDRPIHNCIFPLECLSECDFNAWAIAHGVTGTHTFKTHQPDFALIFVEENVRFNQRKNLRLLWLEFVQPNAHEWLLEYAPDFTIADDNVNIVIPDDQAAMLFRLKFA